MVRSQSMSAGRRGLLVRLARFSAPVTAERVRWLSRRSRSLVTVRTTARAAQRMVELAVRAAGDTPADLAVHHLGAAERADELAERLRERLPRVARLLVSEVGAVIGAHVGIGVLGVVVVPRDAPVQHPAPH